jgi:hypothetical protein
MHASAVPFVDNQFTRTLADAFPPADAGDTKALIADAALRLYDKTVATPRQEFRDNKIAQIQNVRSHSHTPHGLVPKTYEASMEQSTSVIPRTSQEPIATPLKDKRLLTKETRAAIKADFGGSRSYLKVVARAAEASPRTVESWTSDEAPTLPGFEYIARLAPHSPSISKLFARLMHFDPDTDPEAYRALQDLRRAIG